MGKKLTREILILKAQKEVFSFWNQYKYNIPVGSEKLIDKILIFILKEKIVANREVKYLYVIFKKFPKSTIVNLAGMPILKIKEG